MLPIGSLRSLEAINNFWFHRSTFRPIVRIKKQPIRNPVMWHGLANQQLSYKNNSHNIMLAQWENSARSAEYKYSWSKSTFRRLQVSFSTFCWSIMITSIRGSIHQGHEVFSEHFRGRHVCIYADLCPLQLCFSIDRVRSIYGHKQISMTSYVTNILRPQT